MGLCVRQRITISHLCISNGPKQACSKQAAGCPASAEEFGVALTEEDTDDVLRVAAVRAWQGLDARVVEDVDETVVVTGGEEHLVSGAANGVDMGAVRARWVDTRGLPEELAGNGSPNSVLQV